MDSSLAPKLLKKHLKLPAAFQSRGSRLLGDSLEQAILVSSGLSLAQADWLLSDALPIKGLRQSPKFEAIQRDAKPSEKKSFTQEDDFLRFDFDHCPDMPEFGIHYFKARIRVDAEIEQVTQEFKQWFRNQQKKFGRGRPDRRRRSRARFLRDLVVYALSNDKNWSVEDIDEQLNYMSLPSLMSPENDQASPLTRGIKEIRRKLVFQINKLLRHYRQIKLVK